MTPNVVVVAAVAGAWVGWTTAGGGTKGVELRAWDVLVLGPWLLALAAGRAPTPAERAALAFTGAATITHNGRNALGA